MSFVKHLNWTTPVPSVAPDGQSATIHPVAFAVRIEGPNEAVVKEAAAMLGRPDASPAPDPDKWVSREELRAIELEYVERAQALQGEIDRLKHDLDNSRREAELSRFHMTRNNGTIDALHAVIATLLDRLAKAYIE